jgi:hypothetical protein
MVSLPLISSNIETLKSHSINPVVAILLDEDGNLLSHWTHYLLSSIPEFLLYTYLHKAFCRAVWVQKNHCLTRRTEAASGIIFPNGHVGIVMEWDDIHSLIPI